MKKLKFILFIVGLGSLIYLSSCKDDSDSTPSETDQQLITLQNNGTNWVLSSAGVSKDGFDVTSQFTGFKLNIGNKTYTTENGLSPVWEPSGNWDFIDNNPSLILRDGDTQITVSVTSSALTLTFTADAVPTGGRVESVSGEYQFHLASE
ncbi:MAG: hypothetical protein RLO81_02320 [Fulvivirga sp.]|uniref:hypothetical protein n=1 Tax=Fulvivirga sp. TaxID=1931237 RepID=UPI0032EFEB87